MDFKLESLCQVKTNRTIFEDDFGAVQSIGRLNRSHALSVRVLWLSIELRWYRDHSSLAFLGAIFLRKNGGK